MPELGLKISSRISDPVFPLKPTLSLYNQHVFANIYFQFSDRIS